MNLKFHVLGGKKRTKFGTVLARLDYIHIDMDALNKRQAREWTCEDTTRET